MGIEIQTWERIDRRGPPGLIFAWLVKASEFRCSASAHTFAVSEIEAQ
jgi:hypothetical protein